MRVLLGPRVLVPATRDETAYYAPDLRGALGRSQAWGQASSEFEKDGRVAIWARPSAAELDALLGAGWRDLGEACPEADADRMVTALRAGDLRSAREEFVAAYRERARSEEERVRLQRGAALVLEVAGLVGLALGVALVAGLLGLSAAALSALVTLHQDNFSGGTSGDPLDGRVMSDGLGQWSVLLGGWDLSAGSGGAVPSDRCRNFPPAGVIVDQAMPVTKDLRATILPMNVFRSGAAAARVQDVNNFYSFRQASNANIAVSQLRKLVAGVDTLLASGSIPGAPLKHGVECVGTTISGYLNGVLDAGPATDSSLASGRAGVQGISVQAGGAIYDDFLVEVSPARADRPLERGLARGLERGLAP